MENEFKNKVFSWTNIVDIKEAKRWAYDQSCKAEREARGYEAKILARLYLLATEFTEAFDRPELDQEPLDADWQAAKLSMDQPPLKPDAAEALGALKEKSIADYRVSMALENGAVGGQTRSVEKIIDNLHAQGYLITALQNQGAVVPEGWVLVPRGPTKEQKYAIKKAMNMHPIDRLSDIQSEYVYKAAIAAAPTPNAEPKQAGAVFGIDRTGGKTIVRLDGIESIGDYDVTIRKRGDLITMEGPTVIDTTPNA